MVPPPHTSGGQYGDLYVGNPDKRTTAYENIFGRPTAKPKGPAAYPPDTNNWVNHQQAYAATLPYAQQTNHVQTQRYNGGGMAGPSSGYVAAQPSQAVPLYPAQTTPQYVAQQTSPEGIDRRESNTPSVNSDPRMSGYASPNGGNSAADAYGSLNNGIGVQHSAYLSQPAHIQRGAVASPAPSNPLPLPTYTETLPYRTPLATIAPLPVSQPYQRPGSISSIPGETSPSIAAAPRLPSFDLGSAAAHSSESHWFQQQSTAPSTNGTLTGTSSIAPSTVTVIEESYKSPTANSYAEREGLNDFQDYQLQIAQANAHKSAASSYRRGSFESDRQSTANSMYTLPGATSRMQIGGGFYQPAMAADSTISSQTWGRQTRGRTTSSATTQALVYTDPNLDLRKQPEFAAQNPGQRSMSFGQQLRPSMSAMHSGSLNGTSSTPPVPNVARKGPVVYPALLSRVADAFKQRVSVSERAKDGLTYTDAFDGREAVDKIAYIIKTSDRNLALLLGRALDAQKFFHDVTYDHRLRDSPNELYQFRVRLPSPFGSDGEAFQPDGFKTPPSQLEVPSAGPTRDNSLSTLQDGNKAVVVERTEDSAVAEEDEDALPTGVFTLLTDCYSPT